MINFNIGAREVKASLREHNSRCLGKYENTGMEWGGTKVMRQGEKKITDHVRRQTLPSLQFSFSVFLRPVKYFPDLGYLYKEKWNENKVQLSF